MTCDNNRPCERCVARGLADTCQDGVRKKAKYLSDVPDAIATSTESLKYDPRYNKNQIKKQSQKLRKEVESVEKPVTVKTQHMQKPTLADTSPYSFLNNTSLLQRSKGTHDITDSFHHIAGSKDRSQNAATDQTLKPSRHSFNSVAVNMEYSIISNILTSANGSFPASSVSPSITSTNGEDSPGSLINSNSYFPKIRPNALNQFKLEDNEYANLGKVLEAVESLNQPNTPSDWYSEPSTPKRPLSFIISNDNSIDSSHNALSSHIETPEVAYDQPADIYANVKQPFSYTPAYHQLTIYIRTRFNREHQMQIAQCMSTFRPSFIACTKTLLEDDLIFMEQCFQRTLLEYKKFISFSGTPTVVWRRTGQIAEVGKEFCILTGWSRERLLSSFIVELMDDPSALEYFDVFSKLAFVGDTKSGNVMECTLVTPEGRKIRTTSIWTLKRDVFGIPMMIVGNYLPILN